MSSVIILSAYFILWALIHTALASIRVKKWAEKLFGPDARKFYRLFYVIFAALSIAPLAVLVFTLPDSVIYAVSSPWSWVMRAGQVLTFGLLVWTVIQTEALDFLGIEQIQDKSEERNTRLQKRGLFNISRHPMYFSSILLMWLSPVMTVNRLTVYIGITLYFYLGSIHEEQLLVAQFGKDYVRYRKEVPRIIPGTGWMLRLLRGRD